MLSSLHLHEYHISNWAKHDNHIKSNQINCIITHAVDVLHPQRPSVPSLHGIIRPRDLWQAVDAIWGAQTSCKGRLRAVQGSRCKCSTACPLDVLEGTCTYCHNSKSHQFSRPLQLSYSSCQKSEL
jgi:hypothetical protein